MGQLGWVVQVEVVVEAEVGEAEEGDVELREHPHDAEVHANAGLWGEQGVVRKGRWETQGKKGERGKKIISTVGKATPK